MRWAQALRCRYGCPVYLCGSALRADNPEPRDWDVRVILPGAAFRARYGDPRQWQAEGETGAWSALRHRWSADCTERTREGWRRTRLNIDFQTLPLAEHRRAYAGLPRLRLDTDIGVPCSRMAHGEATAS